MSFQILDKDNNPIDINELDKEAALFWNKTIHPKEYAFPAPEPNYEGLSDREKMKAEFDYACKASSNWFDMIGYNIHNPNCNWTKGWANVKASLWSVQSTSMYTYLFDEKKYIDDNGKEFTPLEISISVAKEFLKPFFDLIDHWEAKGYQPKQVKE